MEDNERIIPGPASKEGADQSDRLLSFLVEYEITGRWWTGFMPSFLHGTVAEYMVRKTKKKYHRYFKYKHLSEKYGI